MSEQGDRNIEEKLKLSYPAVVTLIVQSEATTWTRLAHFTTAASFATGAYALTSSEDARLALSLAGLVLSLANFLLAIRSRYFVERYVEYGKLVEAALQIRVPNANQADVRGVLDYADPKGKFWISAGLVALLVPLGFVAVFVLLALSRAAR